ncbi:ubiquitin carboxyl-terminal hydrolase 36-like [Leguminivora glycinivorella]|uniref:ubiquitin carboxyl-terminal hydrolase 36-like n=1 Tax=Leguminivora glycinivorella TaxID=1035111 RepID=UPI00200E81E5|nr:ubiquitin carboxyl-terminal hydrolase 36-like [Leguminivora glycinivorella]
MDNFITNIKNKIMLPGRDQTEEHSKNIAPLIPMPDIDDMTASPQRAPEPPASDVSQIQNEQENSSEEAASTPSFYPTKTLLKSFVPSTDKSKQEEEPKHVPNPIEDDIFIYYD